MKFTTIIAFVSIATSTNGACHPQCPYISVDFDQCLLFRMNLVHLSVNTYRCENCIDAEKMLENLKVIVI